MNNLNDFVKSKPFMYKVVNALNFLKIARYCGLVVGEKAS